MFTWLGKSIYKARWIVLAAGILFMAVSGILGTSVFGDLKAGGYNNPGAESTKVDELLKSELGQSDRAIVVMFTSKDGTKVDNAAFKAAVESTLAKINGQQNVGNVTTYYTTGSKTLVSNDQTGTYAVVGLNGDDDVQLENMKRLRPLLTSDTLDVKLGGYSAVSEEINELVQKDLARAESLSFPIVFVLLVIIFGSLLAASLPLLTGGFAILGAFLILKITSMFADVSIFAVNIVTMLGLGLAIDYSLFMVSRFREELVRQNGNVEGSLIKTMQTAGRTVVFSGFTVMISLLSLLVFPQMFMKSMGWGGASAVFIAMIGAITILPAILALMGPRVNSLSVRSLLPKRFRTEQAAQSSSSERGVWYRVSHFVMRRPVLSLLVVIVPLLIAGLPFLSINISTPDHRSLPVGSQARAVGDALLTDYPRNETQPIEIMVQTPASATDAASLQSLLAYVGQLKALPGVTRVDSLVTLDPRLDAGGAAAYSAFYGAMNNAANPQAAMATMAAKQFSNDNYSLVRVLYNGDTLDKANQELVREIRALTPPSGVKALVGGFTAQLDDFLTSLQAGIPWAALLIVTVMFIILFLMLGSVVVPFKAVLLNILSLSASFGSLVWIFQDGNLHELFGFTPLGSIDGTMPILIFAIAFGLSMDYEVFLLSRVKEHHDQTGDTVQAVANGVQKTGGIITSAALLLVVVIGAFALGEVLFIKMVGLGLAIAIVVDATIVRMILVPATMRILGKWNWWAPAPLAALYRRLGFSEVEAPETVDAAVPARTSVPAKSDNARAGA